MNNRDIRRYEMLVRVRAFGTAHASLFPATSRGGEAFATVAAAVAELSSSDVTRISSKTSEREGATTRAVARAALIESMDAIARTARAIAIDSPGVDDKFRVPRRVTDVALLNTARTFASDAQLLTQQFIDHNMPADFLEDLGNNRERLENVIGNSSAARGTGVVAKTQIGETLDTALTAVRRLDAIVLNTFRDDAATRALWDDTRRVAARHGRSAAPAVTTPATTPPVAAATGAPNGAQIAGV